MKRTLHGMLALIAVFLLHAPNVLAQVDRATVIGVVRDTGGGVVPGATVTVTNTATNVTSVQTTTETGGYQVVNLVRVAEELKLAQPLRAGLAQAVMRSPRPRSTSGTFAADFPCRRRRSRLREPCRSSVPGCA